MGTYGHVHGATVTLKPGTTMEALDVALRPLTGWLMDWDSHARSRNPGDLAAAVLKEVWGAYITTDDAGNPVELDVTGDFDGDGKWYDAMDQLPDLIAPFVQPGETVGYAIDEGDGETYRYYFDGDVVKVQSPIEVWPGEPGYAQAVATNGYQTVTIPDPDDPNGMPIYDGYTCRAHQALVDGTYHGVIDPDSVLPAIPVIVTVADGASTAVFDESAAR